MSETEIVQAVPRLEIAEYEPLAAALADLRDRHQGVVFQCETPGGDLMARTARRELVKLRTALEAKRKELKGPALERSRQIDTLAKRIESEILALEGPIDAQIKAVEERKAAEKAERDRLEKERVDAINARIQTIRNYALKAPARATSEQLADAIDRLNAVPIDDSYENFREYAGLVKCETLSALRELCTAATEREEEAEKLKAEREELERRKAEEEEKRLEGEAILAKARAEHEAFMVEERAKQQCEYDEQRARMKAQREEQEKLEREEGHRRVAARKAEDEKIALQRKADALVDIYDRIGARTDRTAQAITDQIAALNEVPEDTYGVGEFAERVHDARRRARSKLNMMLPDVMGREDEARQEREAEEKRIAEEREKIDAERKALEAEQKEHNARIAAEQARKDAEFEAERQADERIKDAADDYFHAVEEMIRAEADGGITGEAFAEEWALLKEIHAKAKGEAE